MRAIARKLLGRRGSLLLTTHRKPSSHRNLSISAFCVGSGPAHCSSNGWSLLIRALHSKAATACEYHEPSGAHSHHAHEDDEMQVASLVLQSYLKETLKFPSSDAVAVVEHAPSFVTRLVATAKQGSMGAEYVTDCESDSPLRRKLQAFLHSTDVDALEPVLESIGIKCEELENCLAAMSVQSVDMESLLSLIRTFHKLGIFRSNIGSMLSKEAKVFSYTGEQIESGFHTLRGFGIPEDEVLDLIQRYPLVLDTRFVNNIALLDEELCGFSAKNLIIKKAICSYPQHVHAYTRGCAEEVVEYLKSFNFTIFRLDCMLQKHARLVLTDVEKKLKKNVQFLEDLGASNELIGKVINRCPNFLFYGMEDNLIAKLEYFKTLAFDEAEFCGMIARNPSIFSASLENKIKPAVAELRNLGLSGEGLKKVVLYRPLLFGYKLGGAISTIVKDLSDTNYAEDKKVTAFIKLYSRGAEHRKKCEDCLVHHGLSAAEAKEVLEKEPGVLGYNKRALTVKLESLTKEFGIPVRDVLAVPEYLSFELRKRIQRRQRVLSYMKSKGLETGSLSIRHLVLHSNRHFYNTFVKRHREDGELSKVWFKDRDNVCSVVRVAGGSSEVQVTL